MHNLRPKNWCRTPRWESEANRTNHRWVIRNNDLTIQKYMKFPTIIYLPKQKILSQTEKKKGQRPHLLVADCPDLRMRASSYVLTTRSLQNPKTTRQSSLGLKVAPSLQNMNKKFELRCFRNKKLVFLFQTTQKKNLFSLYFVLHNTLPCYYYYQTGQNLNPLIHVESV